MKGPPDMGINDYGNTDQGLNNPPLGGPGGWAQAVRDALNAATSAIAGKVSKAGDTMSGALDIAIAGNVVPLWVQQSGQRVGILPIAEGLSFVNDNNTAYEPLIAATPTVAAHMANKAYVDAGFIPLRGEFESGIRYGIQTVTSDGNGKITFPSIPDGYTIISCFFGEAGNEIFCSLLSSDPRSAVAWHAAAPSPWASATGMFRWIAVKTS
jgi:hypothetical protein